MHGFDAMNSGDRIGHPLSRKLGIVMRLQAAPALCISTEKSGQTQRGINGYAVLTCAVIL